MLCADNQKNTILGGAFCVLFIFNIEADANQCQYSMCIKCRLKVNFGNHFTRLTSKFGIKK
jgi:hypothetical protein